MGWFSDCFKSEEQKWAEAKQYAHEQRGANGQRVRGGRSGAKSYTDAQRLKDQKAILKAQGRLK